MTLPQDSAFSVFPITRSRCATPTSPVEAKPAFSRTQTEPFPFNAKDPEALSEPVNKSEGKKSAPRVDSNALNAINGSKMGKEARGISGHRKNSSISSSKDFTRPMSTGTAKFHMPRPSASSSVYTRNRSTSTVSGTSRLDFDASDVPSVPSLSKAESSVQHESAASPPGLDGSFDFGLGPPKEESGFPKVVKEPTFKPTPEPSPYTHKPRPSVTAAMAPLNSIGSSSSFKPSRSIRGRKMSTAATQVPQGTLNAGGPRDDKRLYDVPPVPTTLREQGFSEQISSHTLHESTSSNGSYSSGAKTGSSRSTPPLQESPRRQKHNAFDSPENSFEGFQFGVETNIPPHEKVTYEGGSHRGPNADSQQHASRAPSMSTQPTIPNVVPPESPVIPEHMSYAQPTIPELSPPESPIIPDHPPFTQPILPHIQPSHSPMKQESASSNSPDDYVISSNLESHAHSNHYHLSPTICSPPSHPSHPPQRSRPPDKGPCRGCGELIKGKSVSSADGRLTGRYHKGCFVCTTCGNPFQTADFYVIRNQPYCARHYHELNNSLCQGCNRGIEGQYLETETHRKFHSYCFTCQECHKILRDDFYEWRGRTLCEQHAFRAANQPSSSLGIGGGGRRFPERRTTKLMMMM